MYPTVVAVVLAAGQSSRLGSPKALAGCGDEPLVRLQVRRLRSLGITCIVVTHDELFAEVSATLDGCTSRIVMPEDPSNRTGNLKAGLNAAGPVEALLVVPVDRPGWSLDTVRRLLESDITCCPQKDGRGGHPLLICGEDVSTLVNAPDAAPLNQVFTPLRIEVDDPFLHLNIDGQEDLARLQLFIESIAHEER